MSGPRLLELKANVSGNVQEAIEAVASLADLDPGNVGLATQRWFSLYTARRPIEAVRVLDDAKARTPGAAGLTDTLRAVTIFAFTGNLEPLAPYSKREIVFNGQRDQDPDDASESCSHASTARRVRPSARPHHESTAIRSRAADRRVLRRRPRPPANGGFRGWADLLLGDRGRARGRPQGCSRSSTARRARAGTRGTSPRFGPTRNSSRNVRTTRPRPRVQRSRVPTRPD